MTGCYDRQELESQAFVTTLGVDKAPDGQIDCTFRIALPKNPSSGGGGGGGGQPLAGSGPVTFRGHTINEAMNLANSSVERTLTMSHLTMIIFGESLARSGLEQYMQPLVRFREFRRTVQVAISKGDAKDVMNANKPMLDQSAGRLADSIAQVGSKTGLYSKGTLHEFITALEAPHQSPALPTFAVNQSVKESSSQSGGQGGTGGGGGGSSQGGGEQGKPTGSAANYQVGKVSRQGGNPVEWIGSAIFKGDKLTEFLNGRETVYLRFLRGTLKSSKMDFPDPTQKDVLVSMYVRKARAPRYYVTLSNPMQIKVDLPLEADVISSTVDYSQPNMRPKLEAGLVTNIKNESTQLLNKIMKGQQTDVIPISDSIRSQFRTYQEYRDYPYEARLKNAVITVQPKMSVRRFGVQMMPISQK